MRVLRRRVARLQRLGTRLHACYATGGKLWLLAFKKKKKEWQKHKISARFGCVRIMSTTRWRSWLNNPPTATATNSYNYNNPHITTRSVTLHQFHKCRLPIDWLNITVIIARIKMVVCVCRYIYTHTYINIYICTHIHTVYTYIYTYTYIYLCVCVCVCICCMWRFETASQTENTISSPARVCCVCRILGSGGSLHPEHWERRQHSVLLEGELKVLSSVETHKSNPHSFVGCLSPGVVSLGAARFPRRCHAACTMFDWLVLKPSFWMHTLHAQRFAFFPWILICRDYTFLVN